MRQHLLEIKVRLLELDKLVDELLKELETQPESDDLLERLPKVANVSLADVLLFQHRVVNVVPLASRVGDPPPNWVRLVVEYENHKALQDRFQVLKRDGCFCGGAIEEIRSSKTGTFWGCRNASRKSCNYFPSFKWNENKLIVNLSNEALLAHEGVNRRT